ncbi:MAG: glycoside hydrolase family 20 zincin-like fold domain-containing protein, partial [Janthinobacterium lividum]
MRSCPRFALSLLLASAALPCTALAQSPLHLIPMPREVTAKGDQPLSNGVQVLCNGCDADDTFTANDLTRTLAERHIPTGGGLRLTLERAHSGAGFTPAMQAEGYTIRSTPGTLTLTAETATGLFYAAQTVKQMIDTDLEGRDVLHAADIRDWPAMRYRGLQDDLSRGPVSTLEFQKKLVRTLAAYKANVYVPYFEQTQQYASNP